MVFIKDLVVAGLQGRGGGGEEEVDEEEGGAKVEGAGSGFVWDSAGHIVSAFRLAFLFGLTRDFRGGISVLGVTVSCLSVIELDVGSHVPVL